MAPGAYLSLGLCLLGLLASATPEEEEPTHELLLGGVVEVLPPEGGRSNVTTQCPKKWFQDGGSCFRYVNCPTTFQDAEDECQSYGPDVHLASIHGSADSQRLAKYVIPSTVESPVWIGLANSGQVCSDWRWTDGSPFQFHSWGRDQPAACDGLQACGQLSPETGFMLWKDADSDTSAPFVCYFQQKNP